MSTIRQNTNGTMNETDLRRLRWPIAWDGTVSNERRAEEKAALDALADEAIELIQGTDQAVAVEIRDGEIVSVITEDTSEG
jgi:hypothetical protein